MAEISGSLAAAAVMIGFVHTVAGPDHYLPFVTMSRAGRWSLTRTIVITLICGVGHILGSVILGFVGIGLGLGLDLIKTIEQTRGQFAGWLLIGFGLMYLVWGTRRAVRGRSHAHIHAHEDGTIHCHEHTHSGDHAHVHKTESPSLTPWALFIIFVLGPCEALIPLLMFPAFQGGFADVLWVVLLFGVTTLATMTTIVAAACVGLRSIRFSFLERYQHALAGGIVLVCGLAIMFGL
ncbi:MAG: hypothetical protein MI923_04550 [Phycisphaerales bacterium]|nr:hypothetical protein [Phycisphaerales bacterium]